ncbi:CopG family transcriptional regulator [Candidatus Thiosymbion oneisti]|uniref:CopG family transcriptional regulator n=1 Tax=Candidatus Thiosymbion oneisti TaxID=589554 RepID=UPI000B7D11ED|nr:CopG family transcriptional regulator [Candidatus Thiosymbion oneisti]
MGQVTIYLEEDTERKMVAAAKSAQLSKSKWIAKLIQEKVANEWPRSIVELVGAWEDFPDIDDIRSDQGKDTNREKL